MREGGLRVYTTIEPRLQRAARRAIKETLNYSDDPAAAIVSVEPGTGAIRAMEAVIPGNTKNQFNLAAQSARQAGSTFKSFVLAAAIEKGADPDSTYYTSAPFTCTSGPWCEDDYKAGKPWQVATYGHTYSGSISVTSATLRSDNTVYAQLTLDVGPDYVWRLAKRLGINLTQKPVASIGLGPLGVSPLEMAAAYATFASGGIYAKPTGIRKVVLPNGKVDKRWGKPQSKRALGEAVAVEGEQGARRERALRHGLGLRRRRAIRRRARRARPRITPTPGTSATRATTRPPSGWAIRTARSRCSSVHGQAVAGATFPVPIWHSYMAAAEWRKPVREFLEPDHEVAYRPLEKHYYGYTAYIPTYTPTHDDDRDDHDDGGAGRQADAVACRADAEAGAERPDARRAAKPPAAGRRRSRPSRRAAELRFAAVSTATDLLTIDEALALVLERVRPLEAEDVPLADAAGRVLAEDARVGRRPAAVPRVGDGRLRAPLGGRAGDAADRRRGSPPAARRRGASRRARRWRSRPAASCPRAPTPSCRSRTSRRRTTRSRCPAPLSRATTSATAEATSAPATRSSSPARGSARRTSARSRPPASPRCAATARRASSWS